MGQITGAKSNATKPETSSCQPGNSGKQGSAGERNGGERNEPEYSEQEANINEDE